MSDQGKGQAPRAIHTHEEAHAHSHDLAHGHDHGHDHTHEHEHAHEHGHSHSHEHGHDHVHEHEEEGQAKPILIELDDLTAEGKAKAEEQLKRAIPDRAYTIAGEEKKPGSVIELALEIPAEAFSAEQSAMLNDLRKEIVLPGFRKGKAPANLVLKRLGEEAVRDTIASLATNALRQEQAKRNWSLMTKPKVLNFESPKEGAAAKIKVELETTPVVELKEYKGFEVEVEKREVSDAMVEARLAELARQGAVEEAADAQHPLADDDTPTVDIEVSNAAGEKLEHLSQKGKALYNWKGNLPEEIVDQLGGKKIGESVEATVKNKSVNRRGEEIFHEDHYRVTIAEIRRNRVPAIDDDFAKDLGDYADLAALKKKVREDLGKAEEERRRADALGKIYRLIVEKNPVDVPKSLVARQQYDMIMRDSQQMQRYGLRLDQVVQDVDAYLHDQRTGADETVRLQMLVAELRKIEKMDVGDADVDAEIARLAEESGRKPLAIRARLEAQNQLDDLRQRIAANKVGEYLLTQSKIKLVEPKPEEEAPEAEANAGKSKTKKAKAEEAGVSDAEPVEAKVEASEAGEKEEKPKAKAKPKAKGKAKDEE